MAKYLDENGVRTLWGKIKEADNTNSTNLTNEINRAKAAEKANTDLIMEAHGKVAVSVKPNVFEKGVETSITFTATANFSNSADKVNSIKIYSDGLMTNQKATTNAAKQGSVTWTTKATDNITAYSRADIGGVNKDSAVTAKAYYPIFLIATDSVPSLFPAETVTSGVKQSISSTGAGSKTITTTEGQYIVLAIPAGVTVPTKATMSGFDCPVSKVPNSVTVNVNGADVEYTLVRTVSAMKTGSMTIVYV